MRTTFIIGNGFDLNLGLKTSYRDFYDYYLKQPSSGNPSIERFKTELKSGLSKKIELWSDMELALGKYTANLSSKNELVSVYDDVWDNLQEYISSIDTESVLTPKAKEKFKNSIIKPTTFLAQRYKSLIENKIRNKDGGLEISILNFNYTNTIENILGSSGSDLKIGSAYFRSGYSAIVNSVIHIHGKRISPIVGLNDESQIVNKDLASNEDVMDYLIKPRINQNLGHNLDERAQKLIRSSDLICIYGTSLGETDNMWWKCLNPYMCSEYGCVIYFVYDSSFNRYKPMRFGEAMRNWKTKLMDAAQIEEKYREKVSQNIYVAMNSNIFNLLENGAN